MNSEKDLQIFFENLANFHKSYYYFSFLKK